MNSSTTLIRLIDTFTIITEGQDVPLEMPPAQNNMYLVIMLKSGKAVGRNELRVIPELPNGSTGNVITFPVQFEGEERGFNVNMNLRGFTFQYEGLYWFRVYIDNVELTAIPFRVKYSPRRLSAAD